MENNEGLGTNLVVSTLEDENDGDFSAGDLSLREAIAIADNWESPAESDERFKWLHLD